jgi:hypothetical protein
MRVLIVSKGCDADAANTPPTTPAMPIADAGESCKERQQQPVLVQIPGADT